MPLYHPVLPLERHLISISDLNLIGLFLLKRDKRDLENEIHERDLRLKK